jgi:hypothetical protein
MNGGGRSKTFTCMKQLLGLNWEAYICLGCVEVHMVLKDEWVVSSVVQELLQQTKYFFNLYFQLCWNVNKK